MKKSIPYWQTAGFLFVSVTGTLLHFAYDWSGQAVEIGWVSAVNESIWEHMKLVFYPMVLFAFAECRAWGTHVPGFWCIKTAGIFAALLMIPILYYTYTGIWGISVDWLNITIFFVTAAGAYWMETYCFRNAHPCRLSARLVAVLLTAIAVLFIAFTFHPPQIPFFRDPVTGTYGLQKEYA